MATDNKIPRAIYQQAVDWYVHLQDEQAPDVDRQACERWLAASPQHRQAWSRLQQFDQQLARVPGDILQPTLDRSRAGRRRLLKLALMLPAAGAAGWHAWQSPVGLQLQADHATRRGQRQALTLADGTQLHLNSHTAVRIRYSSEQRQIDLLYGEILVQTAREHPYRPFQVRTGEGMVRALGTRFSVRQQDDATRVNVFEHAVDASPLEAPAIRVHAGQQLTFNRRQGQPLSALDPNREHWTQGLLIALDQPLAQFLEQLADYRHGIVRCDPAVARLRLSGTFRLDDSDQVLELLAATLPIRIRYLTRFWVRVEAA